MTSKKTLNVIARAMKRKKENDEVEAALIFIQPVCGGFICTDEVKSRIRGEMQ